MSSGNPQAQEHLSFSDSMAIIFSRGLNGIQEQAGPAVLFTLFWGTLFVGLGIGLAVGTTILMSLLADAGLDSNSIRFSGMGAAVAAMHLIFPPLLGGGVRAGIVICQKRLREVGIGDPLLAGFRRFWPMVGAFLLLTLVNAVLSLPVLALGYAVDSNFQAVVESFNSEQVSEEAFQRLPHFQLWALAANLLVFFVMLRLILVLPLVLEGGSVLVSFRRSWDFTSGFLLKSIFVLLALYFCYVLGFVLCCVGLLVAVPTILSLYASLYLHLSTESESNLNQAI
ncbi:MAG: hypothetical protein CMF59_10080 [Leptospiraceae bacterium]|nr:hypothetical protein [Leptospiraceae bacterium]